MDQAENTDPVRVWLEDGVVRVSMAGSINVDHFMDGISAVVELRGQLHPAHILADLSSIEEFEISDEDVYRIVIAGRARIATNADDRIAIVAPTELVGLFGADLARVRDLLAGAEEALPDIQSFVDLAKAQAWVGESVD